MIVDLTLKSHDNIRYATRKLIFGEYISKLYRFARVCIILVKASVLNTIWLLCYLNKAIDIINVVSYF